MKLALAALPVAAAALYATRGEYFTSGRAAGLVAGVVVAALATAALAYAALWNVSLGRRRGRIWATVTIAPVALATLLAGLAEPRIARARDLVASGQLDDAATELRALYLPADDPAWADLHIRPDATRARRSRYQTQRSPGRSGYHPSSVSVFLEVPEGAWICANALALAFRDRFLCRPGTPWS